MKAERAIMFMFILSIGFLVFSIIMLFKTKNVYFEIMWCFSIGIHLLNAIVNIASILRK